MYRSLTSLIVAALLTAGHFGATTAASAETLTHPAGFKTELPQGWRATTIADGAMLLTPPGAAPTDPSFSLRLLTQPINVDAADPSFARDVQSLMAALPGFQQVMALQPYQSAAGLGLFGVWAGANATTAQPVQVQVFATTVSGNAIVLFAAGDANRLKAHTAEVQSIVLAIAPASVRGAPSNADMPQAPTSAQPSATHDASPLAQQWHARLAGMKITSMSSYNSGGGSGGMTSKTEVFLSRDGRFEGRSQSSVSVYVPGMSAGGGGDNRNFGTWRIVVHGGQAILELRYDNGQIENNLLQANGTQTLINGKRWFVTDIN